MTTQNISIDVSPTIGAVSAEYILPPSPYAMMTLAHGAGAGMNHFFMFDLARKLSEIGIATLRFNFPFMEQAKRRPDLPAVAHKTIEAAIEVAKNIDSSLPLFASGKSFGGRMTSQYLSAHPHDAVKGIVFYGFPLHPAKKPSIERADHLKDVKLPLLFLQGTKDELATWELIESVCSKLRRTTLIKLPGADHSFKAGKENNVQILAERTKEWMQAIIKTK